jgi:hypothetical protein
VLVIPDILSFTPSGPSALRYDVLIRSRRISQPLGHLSGINAILSANDLLFPLARRILWSVLKMAADYHFVKTPCQPPGGGFWQHNAARSVIRTPEFSSTWKSG